MKLRTGERVRALRAQFGWTQEHLARVSDISLRTIQRIESGEGAPSLQSLQALAAVFGCDVSTLQCGPGAKELAETSAGEAIAPGLLARQLAGLGYPGLAHLRPRKANPAAVVFAALLQSDLETRLVEALPWVLLTYPDLYWSWLVGQVKLRDAQNRLGFVVGVAKDLATRRREPLPAIGRLALVEQQLERARLVREDTLCRNSMPAAERRWLEANRSPLARHWNLLTGLAADQLSYAS